MASTLYSDRYCPNLHLGVTSSPDNYVNKSVTWQSPREIKFENIEGDKTLQNLYVILAGSAKSTTAVSVPNYLNVNYARINWLYQQGSGAANYGKDRSYYYYIDEIIPMDSEHVKLVLREDVLMTYKDEILANKAIIERQENDYNLYLTDPMFKVYNQKETYVKNFRNGFSRNNSNFVLFTVGG